MCSYIAMFDAFLCSQIILQECLQAELFTPIVRQVNKCAELQSLTLYCFISLALLLSCPCLLFPLSVFVTHSCMFTVFPSVYNPGRAGTHMQGQGCETQMGQLSTKNPWTRVSFSQKILRKGSHFTEIVKNGKSAIFEGKNALRMGKILKKRFHFLREKNPQKRIRVSNLGPHSLSKNNSSTPPPHL